MNTIKKTGRLAAVACAGTLLLACTGRQAVVTRHPAPMPIVGADGYYAIGRAEHVARRYDAAQRAWDAALRLDPRHADTRNGLAVLHAERGNYSAAIALWRPLVDEGTALPAAEQAFLLGNLGYALYLKGERNEALAMLEKACVLDPFQPVAWEHLATVLEALGQTDRALQMMKQARTLRMHDIRRDYALKDGQAPSAAAPGIPAASTVATIAAAPTAPTASTTFGPSPWPEGLARTELRQAGAVIEVRRVEAAAAVPLRTAWPLARADEEGTGERGGVRLEISNGNGTRGMAAAWKRQLAGPEWKSVRLTNEKPFAVSATRIEYRGNVEAGIVARALARRLGLPAPTVLAEGSPVAVRTDLRIVLGWDQRTAAASAGRTPVQASLQAP